MKNATSLICLLLCLFGHSTRSATAVNEFHLDPDTGITLLPGFDAELLYDVPKSQGSWVAMAFDPKGRLIVSDQDDKGVFRVTLPRDDNPSSKLQVESLEGFPYEPIKWGRRTVGGALGFLHAFDSLYMSSMKGFYRIRDTDGDDQYDEFTLLKKLGVGYEHSAHSIILSEDGEALYLVTGNHTRLPDGIPSLQPPVWERDSLLEPMPDAMGHAVGIKPPAGWICRISPDGSEWTMVASGFRNAVDIAINREGELFTYDSDLEFDIGSPWYRPTRVNHVTSASEFGWRAGSAKWPEYFADSNGAVVNIGPGSPTGISFGHHSNFPGTFQDKLFICDWTFGTIYTVDMKEDGSSYRGTHTEFLHGEPLNISAMRFGPDGHMYFLVGGRTTDSKLYRIRYVGTEAPTKARLEPSGTESTAQRSAPLAREVSRRRLRAASRRWMRPGHTSLMRTGTSDTPHVWPSKINHSHRGATGCSPRQILGPVIYGSIALCRHADSSLSNRVIEKLNSISFADLEHDDRLALLRAYGTLFDPTQCSDGRRKLKSVVAKLDPFYPASDEILNTELCRMLSYLDAPTVVPKTISLMKATQTKTLAYNEQMLGRHEYGQAILKAMANTPNSQNIHYAYCLRRVQQGWTLEDRKYYFTWLNNTLQKSGGRSFQGYIRAIREDAIQHLPNETASAIAWLLGEVSTVNLSDLPRPTGPPVSWTMDRALGLFQNGLQGRDYQNGKRMFAAGRCVACHRMQGSGGYSGPDLGSVGKRYSIRDILEAVFDPSRSISEQYQASIVELKTGERLQGRIIYQNEEELALASNAYDFGEIEKIAVDQVKSTEPSQVSLMPPGTILGMNADELQDLIAYLVSGGNRRHQVFKAAD